VFVIVNLTVTYNGSATYDPIFTTVLMDLVDGHRHTHIASPGTMFYDQGFVIDSLSPQVPLTINVLYEVEEEDLPGSTLSAEDPQYVAGPVTLDLGL
jgi:hypothetical protein